MSEIDSFVKFFFNCGRRFKNFNEQKIKEYQLLRGREIVNYSVIKAPFFRRFYTNFDLNDVWNLPMVNKKIMMENLSEYNTIRLKKEELIDFTNQIEKEQNYGKRFQGYNVALSSGTSGNKGIVITSPKEEKYLQAAFFARFSFPKVLRIKWAFLLRVTTPAFQVSKFGQRLTHFSLSLTLEKLREDLQAFQPNILSAPPSMLKLLAKEVAEGRLAINPKRIVSYAEVLEPETKAQIEEVFNTPIHQIYQGSEGSIAISCKHGSLHINEDLVKLQLYNKDGTETQNGEPSFKSIITDLHKKSQPIIRFELNDIITISNERCQCGSRFRIIEQISGRADDLFWSKRITTSELQFIFPDYIRRAIISSSEEIEEYQVIQKNFTKILVRILSKSQDSNIKDQIATTVRAKIKGVFLRYNCLEPDVEIRFEPPIKNIVSGKLIRIKRGFKIT